MNIRALTHTDLSGLPPLQPDDWPDIVPVFEWYLAHPETHPVAVLQASTLVGVGTAISYGSTGWLAHIITHPGFRRRGIGSAIVAALLDSLHSRGCRTVTLFASSDGAPLYAKAGFVTEAAYAFYRKPPNAGTRAGNPTASTPAVSTPANSAADIVLRPAAAADIPHLIELDHRISGEQRGSILREVLPAAMVYARNNSIHGFFLPGPGEGAVLADDLAAAEALLRYKGQLTGREKATLPADNLAGCRLLEDLGWEQTMQAGRMRLGPAIPWQPSHTYSRIGGNLG